MNIKIGDNNAFSKLPAPENPELFFVRYGSRSIKEIIYTNISDIIKKESYLSDHTECG